MTETNRIEYKLELTKELDLVEQLGSGVPRILNSYGKDCFKFSSNFLRMTFPKEVNDGGQTGGTIGGTISGTISGTIEDLTDRQKEVLELIKRDNKLSVRKLAEKLDINVSAAHGHLEILKQKRIIERVGGTRGYWRIIIEH